MDVSIQAQTINLLQDLQEALGLSLVIISHDLAVVEYLCDQIVVMYLGRIVEREYLCDQIAVMYLGRIVETGSNEVIYRQCAHPYTRALLSAIPRPDPTIKRERIVLTGDVPSPIAPPKGCHFHPRCPQAKRTCSEHYPTPRDLGNGHTVACFFPYT